MQEPKLKENVSVRKKNATGGWGIPDRSAIDESAEARGEHSLHTTEIEKLKQGSVRLGYEQEERWRVRSTINVLQDSKSY